MFGSPGVERTAHLVKELTLREIIQQFPQKRTKIGIGKIFPVIEKRTANKAKYKPMNGS
jgi:hypothetical protein